jgi:hypothetical protein
MAFNSCPGLHTLQSIHLNVKVVISFLNEKERKKERKKENTALFLENASNASWP